MIEIPNHEAFTSRFSNLGFVPSRRDCLLPDRSLVLTRRHPQRAPTSISVPTSPAQVTHPKSKKKMLRFNFQVLKCQLLHPTFPVAHLWEEILDPELDLPPSAVLLFDCASNLQPTNLLESRFQKKLRQEYKNTQKSRCLEMGFSP